MSRQRTVQAAPVPVCILGRYGADTWGVIERDWKRYGPETCCPVANPRRALWSHLWGR